MGEVIAHLPKAGLSEGLDAGDERRIPYLLWRAGGIRGGIPNLPRGAGELEVGDKWKDLLSTPRSKGAEELDAGDKRVIPYLLRPGRRGVRYLSLAGDPPYTP